MRSLMIIGASGHGRVVADIARLCGYDTICFLDDADKVSVGHYPVMGKVSTFVSYVKDASFFVAIGNNAVREKILQQLANEKAEIATLIHPQAVVGEDVCIGAGTVVAAGAVINPGVRIGEGVIVNTCASIDHDCHVDAYCHISVGAHLAGAVHIGKSTMIGAGATVINNVSVCAECMIGAGAVVVRDIEQSGTYVGVPVQKIKCNGRAKKDDVI